MAKRTGRCKDILSDEQRALLKWAATWVAGREYYRANDEPSKMEAWDKLAAESKPAFNFNDGNEQLPVFINGLTNTFQYDVPGWDDTKCEWNLRPYACLAYSIAYLDPTQWQQAFDAIKDASALGKTVDTPAAECEAAGVAKDTSYNEVIAWGKDTGLSGTTPQGSSVWPWLLGVAALGVVGLVAFGGDKKPTSSKPNPTGGLEQQHARWLSRYNRAVQKLRSLGELEDVGDTDVFAKWEDEAVRAANALEEIYGVRPDLRALENPSRGLYAVVYGPNTEEGYVASELPGEDTLDEVIKNCREYGVSATLQDPAGFTRGWVHADGSYRLT